MAVLDVGGAVNAGSLDAAEAVLDAKGRAGGHGDVVVDGIGGALAEGEPALFCFGIDGANAHAVAGLLDLDFDLVGEGFGIGARAGLNANRGVDIDVAAG